MAAGERAASLGAFLLLLVWGFFVVVVGVSFLFGLFGLVRFGCFWFLFVFLCLVWGFLFFFGFFWWILFF